MRQVLYVHITRWAELITLHRDAHGHCVHTRTHIHIHKYTHTHTHTQARSVSLENEHIHKHTDGFLISEYSNTRYISRLCRIIIYPAAVVLHGGKKKRNPVRGEGACQEIYGHVSVPSRPRPSCPPRSRPSGPPRSRPSSWPAPPGPGSSRCPAGRASDTGDTWRLGESEGGS